MRIKSDILCFFLSIWSLSALPFALADNVQQFMMSPPETNSTSFLILTGAGQTVTNWQAGEPNSASMFSVNGTFTNFRYYVDRSSADTKGNVFILFNADTHANAQTIGCFILGATTTCENNENISISSPTRLLLKGVHWNAGPNVVLKATAEFIPNTPGERQLTAAPTVQVSSTTRSFGLYGLTTFMSQEETGTYFASGGTLKNLYVAVQGSQTGAALGYTFTLTENRSGASTLIACSISGATTTCNSGTTSTPIDLTKTYSIRVTSAGAVASKDATWGLTYVPTNINSYSFHSVSDTNIGTADAYLAMSAGETTATTDTSEVGTYFEAPTIITNMAVKIENPSGAAKGRTFTVWDIDAPAATTISCSMAGAAASTCTFSGNVMLNPQTRYAIKETVTGLPSNGGVTMGFTAVHRRVMISD
jgi:hypothetical protein